MKVTPHFSLAEFAQPARHGFAREPYPAPWVESRLRPLCEALEIARSFLGDRKVTILSGYRSKEYNAAIGGARRSQHVEGMAADFIVAGVRPSVVHAACLHLYEEGALKVGGIGSYPTFCHIDVRPGKRLARWGGQRTEV